MATDTKTRKIENADTAPVEPATNVPPIESATFEQLKDRLSDIEGVEESVAEFIARNWQRVAVGFGCILLVVWLVNQVQNAEEASEQRASLMLSTAQEAYQTLNGFGLDQNVASEQVTGIAKEQRERAEVVFAENIKALGETKSDAYLGFSKLYQARALLDNGDTVGAQQILRELEALELLQIGKDFKIVPVTDGQQIIKELAALLYAKSMILSDIAQARTSLVALSLNSLVVVEEALRTLARIAVNQDDINQAVSAAKDAISKNPHLADSIERAYQEQGITIHQL